MRNQMALKRVNGSPGDGQLVIYLFYCSSKLELTHTPQLQELLAPKFVEFYSRSWRFIGTKATLSPLISRITRIPEKILQGGYLSSLSIATRMSWAADRVTTRVEDIAYSLLGIFDTHMPLLYGEGERAFARLQEEIMKESDDQSIFAWDFHPVSKQPLEPTSGLLAESPAAFAKSANVVPFRNAKESEPYSLTNKGIRMKLILLPYEKLPASTTLVTAVLECRSDGPFQGPLGITLIRFDHFTRSDQYTRLLTESDNPKPIPLDKILGQNATNVFITKNTFAPQVDMGGGFVIHVNAESSYILTQAYPADCWNQAASIMGTGPQDVGVLIFERPGDKHFAILLRARARNSAPLDLCKSFRDRESLRQALKPYYGVYEHLKITCAQKTDGPLKEGEMVLDSFNPLAGRANVFSGLMDRSPEGRVSYRLDYVFGQEMFIVDVS
jgi:hypothetical protein